MATRRERIILQLDDEFSAGAARAAAAAALLNREITSLNRRAANAEPRVSALGVALGQVNRHLPNVSENLRGTGTSMDRASTSANRMTRQLDTASGRMGLLAEAAITLGPALVPIGAMAVPALTTMAASAGVAALGIGTVALAAKGMGDALGAMNAAALEPTAANIEKMQQELAKLPAATQTVVQHLFDLRGVAQDLRTVSANGVMPGVDRALTALEARIPETIHMFEGLGVAAGDLIGNMGESLSSSRFDEFWSMLQLDAPDQLRLLGQSLGNVGSALADLWVAFTPTNTAGLQWLQDATQRMENWANGLSETEGFRDFIDYLNRTGPQVSDALGAIGRAFLEISKAAAPVGAVVLPILTRVFDAIAKIAASDIGTPLVAMAAGMVALNRAMQVTSSLMGRMGGGGAARSGGMFAPIVAGSQAARTSISQLRSDLRTAGVSMGRGMYADLAVAQERATNRSLRLTRAMGAEIQAGRTVAPQVEARAIALRAQADAAERARSSLRSYATSAARGAGSMALFAASATGAADSIGLGNTAMLASAGLMMGGAWGAAAGAAAGAYMDISASQKDLIASTERMDQALTLSGSNMLSTLAQQQQALAEGNKQIAAFHDNYFNQQQRMQSPSALANQMTSTGRAFEMLSHGGDAIEFLKDKFTGASGAAAASADKLQTEITTTKSAMDAFARASGARSQLVEMPRLFGDAAKGAKMLATNQQDVAAIMQRSAPALKAMGVSQADFVRIASQGGPELQRLVASVQKYNQFADSSAGRSKAFAESFREIATGALDAADSANTLAEAMQTLLSPGMNLSAATDAWNAGLRNLNESLDSSSTALRGNTDAADANRAAIREQVSNLEQVITANAEAGASAQELASQYKSGRQAIMDAGVAEGLDRGALSGFLDSLGLTKASANEAAAAVKNVADQAKNAGNTKLKVDADTAGAEGKLKTVEGLVGGLSGQVADTSVTTKDQASPRLNTVSGFLARLTGKTAATRVTTKDSASKPLGLVGGLIARLSGKVATTIARAQTSGAIKSLNGVIGKSNTVGAQRPTPVASAAVNGALGLLQSVITRANTVGAQRPTPVVSAETSAAQSALSGVLSTLGSIVSHAWTATVNVVKNFVGGLGLADGGIVYSYATGGVWRDPMDRPNAHPPHISRAGTIPRVFAEPETRGEAYIPLANDHRRDRAIAIWRQTGALLGQAFANGGITGEAFQSRRLDQTLVGMVRDLEHRQRQQVAVAHLQSNAVKSVLTSQEGIVKAVRGNHAVAVLESRRRRRTESAVGLLLGQRDTPGNRLPPRTAMGILARDAERNRRDRTRDRDKRARDAERTARARPTGDGGQRMAIRVFGGIKIHTPDGVYDLDAQMRDVARQEIAIKLGVR